MERRSFIASMAAGFVAMSMVSGGLLSSRRETVLVGSIGTWAEGIARAISARCQTIELVGTHDLDKLGRSRRLYSPHVALLGALGGHTGLRVAREYTALGRAYWLQIEAFVLLPAYWEGLRRIDLAAATLKVLEDEGAAVTIVQAKTRSDQTLRIWADARKQALEGRFLRDLELCHQAGTGAATA